MKEVKVLFDPGDVKRLDCIAKTRGVSRSEYIRDKVLYGTGTKQFSPAEYYELVTECCRRSNMPRTAVEPCVNYVFNALMASPGSAASPD